jgi:mRNA interferase MazF
MKRGEIWYANLDPVLGNEQSGKRPVLILSVDSFNTGGSRMVVAVPLTSRDKKQPLHVPLKSKDSGLPMDSYIKTEDIRGLSKERLLNLAGMVDMVTLNEVEIRVKRLLGLD